MILKSVSPLLSAGLFLLFCFAPAGSAKADGYRNPPEGARAIGAFGGQKVFADDANAAIHNPANLVDLDRPMIQINTTFGYGRNEFETAGVSDRTRKPFFAIPGFSAAVPFQDGKYALGLAAYVPYGRSVEWKRTDSFAGLGLPFSGSMMVADFTPNLAVRLNDSVSIAVGADFYYGKVEQRQFVAPGIESRLTGDGTAVGWNCALTWKVTERQRIAATYRSPFDIRYSGNNEFSTGLKTDIDAKISYPTIIGLGYGVQLTDTVRAEINGEWVEFSRYQNLLINDSVSGPLNVPQNLKNTWTAGIGVEWNFRPQWTLRSGYKYLRNPTPDSTYSPLSPDEDQGVIGIGIGYENDRHAVDVGFAYGLFDGRTIPAPNPAAGKYDYDVRLLTVSYGYKF